MRYIVALIKYDNETGNGTLFTECDGRLYVSNLNEISTKTVTNEICRISGEPIDRVKLREQPKRRRDNITLWEFMAFDNMPPPF